MPKVRDCSAIGPYKSNSDVANDPLYLKLTHKQQVFAVEYLRCGDTKKSAELAGYNSVKSIGYHLLHEPRYTNLQSLIRKYQVKRAEDTGVDAKRIVKELSHILFFNPQDICDEEGNVKRLSELDRGVASAIKTFKVSHRVGVDKSGEIQKVRTVEVVPHCKIEAAKTLAKILGITQPKSINNTVNLINWQDMTKPQGQIDEVEKRLQIEERDIIDVTPEEE